MEMIYFVFVFYLCASSHGFIVKFSLHQLPTIMKAIFKPQIFKTLRKLNTNDLGKKTYVMMMTIKIQGRGVWETKFSYGNTRRAYEKE